MTAAMLAILVTLIMSVVELIELRTGLDLGIGHDWVEATLIVLTPPLSFLAAYFYGWRRQ